MHSHLRKATSSHIESYTYYIPGRPIWNLIQIMERSKLKHLTPYPGFGLVFGKWALEPWNSDRVLVTRHDHQHLLYFLTVRCDEPTWPGPQWNRAQCTLVCLEQQIMPYLCMRLGHEMAYSENDCTQTCTMKDSSTVHYCRPYYGLICCTSVAREVLYLWMSDIAFWSGTYVDAS